MNFKKAMLFLGTFITTMLVIFTSFRVEAAISNEGNFTEVKKNNVVITLEDLKDYYYAYGNYKYFQKSKSNNEGRSIVRMSPFNNTYVVQTMTYNNGYTYHYDDAYYGFQHPLAYANRQYVVSDDPITNFVSKEYFTTNGLHSFVGKDYGCLIITKTPDNVWNDETFIQSDYSNMIHFNQVFIYKINREENRTFSEGKLLSYKMSFSLDVIVEHAFYTVSVDQLNKNKNNRLGVLQAEWCQSDNNTNSKELKRYTSVLCLDESLKGKTGYIVTPVLSSLKASNGSLIKPEKVNGFAIASPEFRFETNNAYIADINVLTNPSLVSVTEAGYDWNAFFEVAAKNASEIAIRKALGSSGWLKALFNARKAGYIPYSENTTQNLDLPQINDVREKEFNLFVEEAIRNANEKNKDLTKNKGLIWDNRRYDDDLFKVNVGVKNYKDNKDKTSEDLLPFKDNTSLDVTFAFGFIYLDNVGARQCLFLGESSNNYSTINIGSMTDAEIEKKKKAIQKSMLSFKIQITARC